MCQVYKVQGGEARFGMQFNGRIGNWRYKGMIVDGNEEWMIHAAVSELDGWRIGGERHLACKRIIVDGCV